MADHRILIWAQAPGFYLGVVPCSEENVHVIVEGILDARDYLLVSLMLDYDACFLEDHEAE